MTLSIIATIRALPEHHEAVLAALTKVLAPTREEPGCKQYDLHLDPADCNQMVIIERWVDESALSDHIASRHLSQLRNELRGKTESTSMQRLNLVA